MDVYFEDEELESLFEGEKQKGKPLYKEDLLKKFRKVVLMLSNSSRMEELWKFNSLNFEALHGDKEGLYSVRIDIHYRLELSIERILDDGKFVQDIIHIVRISNHYA